MTPLISVIICTRNRAQALRETLSHYHNLQFDRGWELVLVDNNSTDDTPLVIDEIAKSELPIKATRCVTIGLGAAREHGRVFASGRILLFTDDDCYPDVNLLEAYCSIFEDIPSLGFCGGRILLWDEKDILLTVDYREKPETFPPHQFIVPGSLQGANLAIKADVLEAIGGVDVNLGAGTPFPCEDIDLVVRASYAGFSGRFDPRAVIYHHHQRKEIHRAGIMNSYDRGRGALYMKLLMRADTRRDCASHWYWSWRRSLQIAIQTRSLKALRSHSIEIWSGRRYLFYVLLCWLRLGVIPRKM